ncbi:MAG TPA: hypothetical protein VH912_25975 [Streptosporangiaceae bacterium]
MLVYALIFVVGISIYQIRSAFTFAVGTSLVATGVAGWVIFFWVRQSDTSARALQSLAGLGITDAFVVRSVPIRNEYEARFRSSRDQISIMGFGLRALREDFGDQFADWARSTSVRILLLDPEAPSVRVPYADQRDAEENNPVGSIRSDVAAMLSFTVDMRNNYPDSFQIRLYSCLPSINVCIIDDEAFWGPYILGRQSRNTVTFLCRRGGHMYTTLVDHFEQIWNSPTMSRSIQEK